MDLALILVVVLVIVLIWRGPKTLPLLGRAFGQGVKEARKEIEGVKDDATATGRTERGPDDGRDRSRPSPDSGARPAPARRPETSEAPGRRPTA